MAWLVSCTEFARLHALSVQRVRQLAREGRIAGAERVGERWVMPRAAVIVRRPPGRPPAPRPGAAWRRSAEREKPAASASAIDAFLIQRSEQRRRLLRAAAAEVIGRLHRQGVTCVPIGSAASGDVRPESDLDVLVLRHPGQSWARLDRLAARAAARFGVNVDLVFAETLAPREIARLVEGRGP